MENVDNINFDTVIGQFAAMKAMNFLLSTSV